MLALLAHAAPISYKFPLPIWIYVLAGGAAVLLSAPAAAFAVSHAGRFTSGAGADLYPFVRRLRLGVVATVVLSLLLLVGLVGGLFATSGAGRRSSSRTRSPSSPGSTSGSGSGSSRG